ncbi:MAG: hypothetical protein AUJ92_04370 [Armatimonadetes bacterium CG2_30_59_28]|nr:hypothetical protein [Armatimonadota bacterium]OIO97065.1 MAG: hypothetical protein AUJ92_04370 [Armatimonadetes bacterium CG2_30_59_28]PIU63830.1 MAG: hypothetical protein COS85_14870 [Armatimonadetes bacterium CG07_land_8_20_14_0_80_59_28]PIX39517.1 MAG: hypothetical protein COZ56_17310 [Armatimonadetes bacterium CG_4_8_14_3_um_filter_58_9]PIY48884.1 MAG: hypothetical protein COZ05_01870 [Armatimonadetes bacterium CG_4_10_14_3_um_filter_59_10]PJB72784.1 MAG: hypothetical protein CO095_064
MIKGRIDSHQARAWLEGYRAADAVIAAERQRRLPSLTQAEARAEFERLWEIWDASPKDGDFVALDRARAAFLVARRRKFDLASQHNRTIHERSL